MAKFWPLGLLPLALVTVAGCRPQREAQAVPPKGGAGMLFRDVTEEAGIEFTHNSGARGKKYMPETVGSGCAFLDYDRDGLLDLFLVNSKDWPGAEQRDSRCKLYHNLGGGKFEDVSKTMGVDLKVYGMGASIGDFDNDGWDDLYLTCLGQNFLFKNEGGKRFRDVTRETGTAGRPSEGDLGVSWKWSSSAAWLDYDRDGDLDLFVLNYVKWSPKRDLFCGVNGLKGYCPPDRYEQQPSILYRNEGGRRFRDITAETGLMKYPGKSFGIAVADYDSDGWPDIAVANDTFPNFFLRNQKGKGFVDDAVAAGIALGEAGNTRAGMGIDAQDWDNSGQIGIAIGNFSTEGLALYKGDGAGVFTDVSHASGLAGPSLLFLTFGMFFADLDLDGWQDVLAGNGHIDDLVNQRDSRITYEQRPLLFKNQLGRSFLEIGATAGEPAQERRVIRGLAYGDYDNDGRPDVLGVCNNNRAFLWRNDGGVGRHWLRLRLEGVKSNRNAIGATVRLQTSSGWQTRFVRSGTSFLSEHDRRPLFGLGPSSESLACEITWPTGEVTSIKGPIAADRTYRIREGDTALTLE